MSDPIRKSQRIVVKAGTSILTSREGHFSQKNLERLGGRILDLHKKKREVVLVSSGAIALGMEAVGSKQRPSEMAGVLE